MQSWSDIFPWIIRNLVWGFIALSRCDLEMLIRLEKKIKICFFLLLVHCCFQHFEKLFSKWLKNEYKFALAGHQEMLHWAFISGQSELMLHVKNIINSKTVKRASLLWYAFFPFLFPPSPTIKRPSSPGRRKLNAVSWNYMYVRSH